MASTTLQNVSLGIRNIGARTDFAGSAVTDLSAEEDRFINDIFGQGVFTSSAYQVVAGAAATMNVVVGSGTAKNDLASVLGADAGQGNYLVRLESATETIALTAADASLARKDEIYIVVLDDAYDSSGKALAVLALRTGTAAASPALPGPDAAWDASYRLATIDVPASAADILACTITDVTAAVQILVQTTDSDKLDGVQGSGYATSGHDHDADYAEDDHVHESNMHYSDDIQYNGGGGSILGLSTAWTQHNNSDIVAPTLPAGAIILSQRYSFITMTDTDASKAVNFRLKNFTDATSATFAPYFTINTGSGVYHPFSMSIAVPSALRSGDGDEIGLEFKKSSSGNTVNIWEVWAELHTVYYVPGDSDGPSAP